MSGILDAAYCGDIEWMKQLLANEASINEVHPNGWGVLLCAAVNDNFLAMKWLLEEGGASISKVGFGNRTVWENLEGHIHNANAAELSSLLKVMVILQDAPDFFVAELSPLHAELCAQGKQLRAQLPSYLKLQRTSVMAHCHLPAVLQSLVAEYAATTAEDVWKNGLRV
jgi:hypothetical protein